MSYFWPKKGLVGPNLQKKKKILINIVLLRYYQYVHLMVIPIAALILLYQANNY